MASRFPKSLIPNSKVGNVNSSQENSPRKNLYPCVTCNVNCGTEANLQAHMRKTHALRDLFVCRICDIPCGTEANLQGHIRKTHGVKTRTQSFPCRSCNVRCLSQDTLDRHIRRRHNALQPCHTQHVPEVDEVTSEPPSKKQKKVRRSEVICRTCSATFDGWREFYVHRRQIHQRGGLEMRPDPFEEDDIIPPWSNENGDVMDEALRDTYERHRQVILESHRLLDHRVVDTYNFPFSRGVRVETLMHHIDQIYLDQQHAFRLNLSFGLILRNPATEEMRYFYPHNNQSIWENPMYLSSRNDFLKIRRSFRGMELEEMFRRARPSTQWRVVMVTNVRYVVTKTSFPLGGGEVVLPDYIKNSKSIVGMAREDHHGVAYTDNYCFFRCLAYHRSKSFKGLETTTKKLFDRWCEFQGQSGESFEGIDPQDLPDVERCFGINIEVLALQEDESVQSIYRSCGKHTGEEKTLYLNLYSNHLSYVTKIDAYSKKFKCVRCDRLFPRVNTLKTHMKACEKVSAPVLPGGYFKGPRTIFDDLELYDIHVPREDRRYPWFATFDMESVLEKVPEDLQPATDKLTWLSDHVPVSVSMCSNIPGFTDAKTVVDPDLDNLLRGMFSYLKEMADRARELALATWRDVSVVLDELLSKWKPDPDSPISEENVDDCGDIAMEVSGAEPPSAKFLKKIAKPNVYQSFQEGLGRGVWNVDYNHHSDDDDDHDDDDEKKIVSEKVKKHMYKTLTELKKRFTLYTDQLIVIGFNSAKYDLPLVKAKFAKHMGLAESSSTFTVKKNNAYMCITSEDFRFLDVSQFLSATMSYKSFLKAYQVPESKGFFPYEWFTSFDLLDQTHLPPIEAFYSTLKSVNTLEEDWLAYVKLCESGKSKEEALKILHLSEVPMTKEANYAYLQSVWETQEMETMKSYLIYYNSMDVAPLVTCIERMQSFYFDRDIDLFKDCISVPGVARRLLFRCAEEEHAHFSLPSKDHADLYAKIKRGIVGGPSILFTRKHKVGETFIRNDPDKPCGVIAGYDSNALYLLGLSMDMPTGSYIRRREEKRYRAEKADRFFSMYDWMEWLMHKSTQFHIRHKENFGREIRVGPYSLDGYDPDTKTAFEFYGCWFHGHESCPLNKTPSDDAAKTLQEKRRKNTSIRRDYLIQEGYTMYEVYECEFNREKRLNPALREFIKKRQPAFTAKYGMGEVSSDIILEGVKTGELFGILECDISIPKEWKSPEMVVRARGLTPYQYFEEFCPLFATMDIPYESFGDHMQQHLRETGGSTHSRRLLVSGMRGERMLLATPMVSWCLSHDMEVTHIYEAVEYIPHACFKRFTQQVTTDRRDGDELLANVSKLIGNSAYGSLLLDKSRHTDVLYVSGRHEACLKANEPRYKSMTELDDDQFEIEMSKKKITLDMPIQLGFFILQYAKLRMLQFYYDCIDHYCDRSSFELLETDTDSLYMGLSGPTLADVVRPELKEEFTAHLQNHCREKVMKASDFWFPRTCCEKHAAYDSREPGLFKLEFSGVEMICLCSKTYAIAGTNETKFSCKGVQRKRVDEPLEIFRSVLNTHSTISRTNIGFRCRDNHVSTYSQDRGGFGYFYVKREVQSDGIHTKPLDITLRPATDATTVFASC